MISSEEREKLLINLENKCLNTFTIEYIIQYANICTDIFNINHNVLIRRLSNNLANNITFSKNFNPLYEILGSYNYKSKQIFISPKIKNKQHIISIIFHELDHAANYQDICFEDKLKFLSIYYQRLSSQYPFMLNLPFIKTLITKRFLNFNSCSSGFNNPLIGKALGVNLNCLKKDLLHISNLNMSNI